MLSCSSPIFSVLQIAWCFLKIVSFCFHLPPNSLCEISHAVAVHRRPFAADLIKLAEIDFVERSIVLCVFVFLCSFYSFSGGRNRSESLEICLR